MEPPLWTAGASAFPHEREALDFVRQGLPNFEPYRAWSNVEFISEDGKVNEVDLLVVSPRGFFLVEIKSFPGKLFGDNQRWRNVRADGTERVMAHPLLLADAKAKRLRSLLARQRALKGDAPWVTPVVFLSSPELDCRLHGIGRMGVTGRDPQPAADRSVRTETAFPPLPGIVATLKDPSKAGLRGAAINTPLSRRIAAAIEQAGIKPSNRGRKAGDWELGALLDEGPGWQDFLGHRPAFETTRRVRIYLAGLATSDEEQARLRREAEREFKLLEQLRHDHIAHPTELVQAERGPAVLFERVEGEERLDLWATHGLAQLDLGARIELVRQLAEALAHAHARKVTHRTLSARSVLVRPGESGEPQLVVGHWQAGARELATELTRHPTATGLGADLAQRLAADEQVYLAPETFSVEHPDPVALDVFSLGSLAYLLLTGRAPADDVAARDAMLVERGGLDLAAAVDHLPESLQLFVSVATDPVPSKRATVPVLLDWLDAALDELTAPETDEEPDARAPEATADPVAAHRGDVLEGGWEVLRRLGSGSTAVALLAKRPGSAEPEVLKVAKDEEYAERLRDEARALERLKHPGVVESFGVERIGGRTTLRLAPAGDVDSDLGLTLADRLRAQGRLGLDLLERFGDDLLDVVYYLETEGIAHRDIKPDNLGVRSRRGDRSLHLVLFDFSLTRTPDATISAGTPGYLDPFLAERPGKRWDPAAERYAAAVTLYEMATGVRPRWGDGHTDPLHLPDEVPNLDDDLFDPAVRDGLRRFFAKALHRTPARRFDTADEMRLAWRDVFKVARGSSVTVDGERPDPEDRARRAAAATLRTPVAELGLTASAVSALERRGVTTVEQLLAMSTVKWNHAMGVGLGVRREVTEAITLLREHLEAEPSADDAVASIDRLAAQLVPRPTTAQAQADGPALTYLLGLDGQGILGEGERTVWPAAREVMAAMGLDREGYDGLLDRARARWTKSVPAITAVRNELATLLERSGGVLPADDLAEALLARRGSTAPAAERLARARAVVRAALETEQVRANHRFIWRRLGGGTTAVVALRNEELVAEELADYAASLGLIADRLVDADPLPTPAAVLERLREVPVPVGLPALADARLVRLAAASSTRAAASSRLELYPRGMAPDRALRLARSALLGTGTLTEDEVRERVRSRFPLAAELPPRPQLDLLLEQVLGLEWHEERADGPGAPGVAGYRVPPVAPAPLSSAYRSTGAYLTTGSAVHAPDRHRLRADAADARLARSAADGGYLVLTVHPRHQQRAIAQLRRYGPTVIDLDRWIVDALRRITAGGKPSWDTLVRADGVGPAGPHWGNLLQVVRRALEPLTAEVLGHEHVLLTHPGLLGRYHQLGLLDVLREHTRAPGPHQRLRTLWVLVAFPDEAAAPTIDGRAVPYTTLAELMPLPKPWLDNVHRTTPVAIED